MIEFKITEESIIKINKIINEMEGDSFHNHYHIIYDIITSIDSNEVKYMEIGSYAGASISLISSHPKVTKSYSLDIGSPISKEIPIKNVNHFKNEKCEYTYIEGNSMDKEVIDTILRLVEELDVLFIDGDHSYNAVINDFKNYNSLVKKGGYLIFDDYMDSTHSPDVKQSVDWIVNNLILNNYSVIGSIAYDLLSKTNIPYMKQSNVYILRKN
jgi:cephalosporin hydroxylase